MSKEMVDERFVVNSTNNKQTFCDNLKEFCHNTKDYEHSSLRILIKLKSQPDNTLYGIRLLSHTDSEGCVVSDIDFEGSVLSSKSKTKYEKVKYNDGKSLYQFLSKKARDIFTKINGSIMYTSQEQVIIVKSLSRNPLYDDGLNINNAIEVIHNNRCEIASILFNTSKEHYSATLDLCNNQCTDKYICDFMNDMGNLDSILLKDKKLAHYAPIAIFGALKKLKSLGANPDILISFRFRLDGNYVGDSIIMGISNSVGCEFLNVAYIGVITDFFDTKTFLMSSLHGPSEESQTKIDSGRKSFITWTKELIENIQTYLFSEENVNENYDVILSTKPEYIDILKRELEELYMAYIKYDKEEDSDNE